MSACCVPGTPENTLQTLKSLILTRTPTQAGIGDQTNKGRERGTVLSQAMKLEAVVGTGFKSGQHDYKVGTLKHGAKWLGGE